LESRRRRIETVESPVVAKVVSKKGGKKAKKPKATVEEEAVIAQMNDPTPSQKKSQKVKIQAEIATMETPAVENIAHKKAAASSKSTTPSKKSLTWGPNKVKEFDLKMSIGKAPTALIPALVAATLDSPFMLETAVQGPDCSL
jgi:hypothetical protein